MKTNTDYTGWKNHQTWAIYQQVLADKSGFDFGAEWNYREDLARLIEKYVIDCILNSSTDGIAQDLAISSLHDVCWIELAEQMIKNDSELGSCDQY